MTTPGYRMGSAFPIDSSMIQTIFRDGVAHHLNRSRQEYDTFAKENKKCVTINQKKQ